MQISCQKMADILYNNSFHQKIACLNFMPDFGFCSGKVIDVDNMMGRRLNCRELIFKVKYY
ncbi:MAG: hypothetical protein H7844_07450 [Nitrospirae bacterium YQR-1]